MNPILEALRALGGSATIEELNSHVASAMKLTDEQLAVLHDPERRGGQTEVAYRMAWARSYLKAAGLLTNSERGVWSLTPEGNKAGHVDEKALTRQVQAKYRATPRDDEEPREGEAPTRADERDEHVGWQERLIETLQAMPFDAFERLCQRVLRESGFTQVQVTGRSNDKGIDGIGLLRLHGVLSFHVIFQCKRWKDPVDPGTVRDFRGAMVGRTDKGLIMTTSTFTRAAKQEAQRDGAPPIDLIDGEQLADLLKRLKLGVKTEMVEHVTVDRDWFASI